MIIKMFKLNYFKNKNGELFKDLGDEEFCHFKKIQNYCPTYENFFQLSEQNWNNVNLNHNFSLCSMVEKININVFKIEVKNKDNEKMKKESFFKFSPLMDPIKYMTGKYKKHEEDLLTSLPGLEMKETNCLDKMKDRNNSAYIDAFFSFLSSRLLHDHKFLHGLDYYGSFLGVQKDYKHNVIDELDYLYESKYFFENNGKKFNVESINDSDYISNESRSNKKKLKLVNEDLKANNIISEIKIDTINEEIYDGLFELTEKNLEQHNSSNKMELVKEYEIKSSGKKTPSTHSECSSRSSNTDNEDEKSDLESCSNSQKSNYSSEETEDDEPVYAEIKEFPVNMICLEKMDQTLDSLMELDEDDEEDDLTDKEWKSCFFQIIMILLAYQKSFKFTHNDLHTNNIMFNKTDKKVIYYKFNNIHYKVPTYGKIYKIIDFGRAIYSLNGIRYCSDSFHPKGDASTQYNCLPYYNENKPLLEPNMSFDLCRFACSLFDYFFEEIEDIKNEHNEIALLVNEWCSDDRGRNILYKNNGDERYPEFKLYKMIARKVHKHTPEKQLDKLMFHCYKTSKKKMPKKAKIVNIDEIPEYF